MKLFVVALVLAAACVGMPRFAVADRLPDGSPCLFNRDCISLKCRGGAMKHCQGPACLPRLATCLENAQCCSGKCRGGEHKRCQGD